MNKNRDKYDFSYLKYENINDTISPFRGFHPMKYVRLCYEIGQLRHLD